MKHFTITSIAISPAASFITSRLPNKKFSGKCQIVNSDGYLCMQRYYYNGRLDRIEEWWYYNRRQMSREYNSNEIVIETSTRMWNSDGTILNGQY